LGLPQQTTTLVLVPVVIVVVVVGGIRSNSPKTLRSLRPSTRCAPRFGCAQWLKAARFITETAPQLFVSDALLTPATEPALTLKPTILVDDPSENSTAFRKRSGA
jgi:hypothetical protein